MYLRVSFRVATVFSILASFTFLGCREYNQGGAVGSAIEVDEDYVPPKETLTSFQLTDQKGRPFDSESMKGEVWVGSFFFAACPTTCFKQNVRVGELQREFSAKGLKLVSITCDPQNDTPSKLDAYSKQFDADPSVWFFLSDPSFEYLKRIANDFFNLPLAEETHSDLVALFDRDGNLFGTYSVLKPDEFLRLSEAIPKLLSKHAQVEEEVSESVIGSSTESDGS